MDCRSKELCKIRTITIFTTLTQDKSLWEQTLVKATYFCNSLSQEFIKDGYEVQSIRLVSNPFGEYLNTTNAQTAIIDLREITQILDTLQTPLRIRFAIGEAKNKEQIAMLPLLIKHCGDLANACVNVVLDENGVLDNEVILCCAQTVKEISECTVRGEGNFNFTVNFNCKPLIPYFPASYYHGHNENERAPFVIGLETPDLLVEVLKQQKKSSHNVAFNDYYSSMSEALQFHVDGIQACIHRQTIGDEFYFAGIDSSAAPSKNCSSMTEVYHLMGVPYFGASGTVEASALLTRVFKNLKNVQLVGFSGLMLAVTEDMGLAEGSKEQYDIRSLLTYSAVCGIGLDTVPIPGDTSVEKIAALMRDTGTMAFRLNKPLTVRLFPLPNLQVGDKSNFESDDLCNSFVLSVP